jgi:hypothetical protein
MRGDLLEKGRVKRKVGLAPKTMQNVDRMLHRALTDAITWSRAWTRTLRTR